MSVGIESLPRFSTGIATSAMDSRYPCGINLLDYGVQN
jgi:hypothetical protein